MRKFLALAVLTAGFLALNQAFWSHEPNNREDRLADMTRILTGPAGSVAPTEVVAPRPSPVAGAVPAAAPVAGDAPTTVATAPPPSSAPPTAAAQPTPSAPTTTSALPAAAPAVTTAPAVATAPAVTPWQTAVVSDPTPVRPDPRVGQSNAGDATPELTQRTLVLAIQSELKRVRCYDGPSDGAWTPKSKQAMQRFIELANASLPTRDPDAVHLSLLKAQRSAVCGSCPKGQSLSSEGTCMPNAIVARSSLKARPVDVGASASDEASVGSTALPPPTVTASSNERARPELFGRMSIGAPMPPTAVGPPAVPRGSRAGRDTLAALAPDDDAAVDTDAAADLPDDGAYDDPNSGDASDRGGVSDERAGRAGARDARRAAIAGPRQPRPAVRFAAPPSRPARHVARPAAKPRAASVRYRSRSVRSVQSLFTHPLGRM